MHRVLTTVVIAPATNVQLGKSSSFGGFFRQIPLFSVISRENFYILLERLFDMIRRDIRATASDDTAIHVTQIFRIRVSRIGHGPLRCTQAT